MYVTDCFVLYCYWGVVSHSILYVSKRIDFLMGVERQLKTKKMSILLSSSTCDTERRKTNRECSQVGHYDCVAWGGGGGVVKRKGELVWCVL